MEKDALFLLAPGFQATTGDGGNRREFCPECAEIWGVLHYFPAIKEALDIRYEPLAHPRPGLAAILGAGEWNCPTLIFGEGADAGPFAAVKSAKGVHFLDNARDIAKYFAHRFGTPFPR
ncbi:DUF3088 family protein [Hyphococcus sp.]|jgi:hypothetical protein|uniref:DUF3088 family protein n=1 Tax=Hyphococcus sp. TaxID=2038636 RepID=UPI003D0B6613